MLLAEVQEKKHEVNILIEKESYVTACKILLDMFQTTAVFASETALFLAREKESKSKKEDWEDETESIVKLYHFGGSLSERTEVKAESFFHAGWLLQQRGQRTEASFFYEQALIYARKAGEQASSTRAHTAFWLAAFREMTGEYLEALSLYEEAIQHESSLELEALYRIFCTYCQLYDFKQVQAAYVQLKNCYVLSDQEERKKALLEQALPQYNLFISINVL